ncbi:DUF167 family protein [Phenylobacterium sp.]|uniref:DUF167 family protein n=1 Tax=Phenylobacterium sp. TaxID=1871053 RepID=UPI0039C8E6C3
MRLAVQVTPRAGRDEILGWARDPAGRPVLKVRVAAAAVDGGANAALTALVAKALGRPKSAARLVSGQAARFKRLEIDGVEAADLAAAFGPPPGQGLSP